jgi:hypothetical protein
MPIIALLNVFTAISIRGFFGFLVGPPHLPKWPI